MAIAFRFEKAKDFSLIPNVCHMGPLERPQFDVSRVPEFKINPLPKKALDRRVGQIRMIVVLCVPIEALKYLVLQRTRTEPQRAKGDSQSMVALQESWNKEFPVDRDLR